MEEIHYSRLRKHFQKKANIKTKLQFIVFHRKQLRFINHKIKISCLLYLAIKILFIIQYIISFIIHISRQNSKENFISNFTLNYRYNGYNIYRYYNNYMYKASI